MVIKAGGFCLVFWFFTQAHSLVSLPENLNMKTLKNEQTRYWFSVFHCPSGEKTNNSKMIEKS